MWSEYLNVATLRVDKYATCGNKSATNNTALVKLMRQSIQEEIDDSIHGRIKSSLVRGMSLLK